METATTVIAALMMAAGIAGLIVPVLPGLGLVLGGVLVWALGHHGTYAWTVFVIACVVAAAGWVIQYLLPGRHLSRAGVAKSSSLFGLAVGIAGFFIIPVVGLFVGFVLGVYVAEYARLRDRDAAWSATKVATKAAVMSVWIELLAAVTIVTGWAIAVITR